MNARFVKPEGWLSSSNLEVDGRTACELVVQGGVADAAWEVMSSDRSPGVTSLSFGVFAAYESCPATNTPLPGTVTVTGDLSPTYTSVAASSTLPIPRFLTSFSGIGVLFTIFRD